jgi:Tfp pilus assembly protein PilF
MNNNVGIFLFRQGKIIEAENYFKISTESNPKWPIGWNNLGVAQEQQQQLTAALNSYYQSQEAAPFNLGYENYAKLLFKLNEKEKLIHFLKEKALPTFPTNHVLNSIWLKVK